MNKSSYIKDGDQVIIRSNNVLKVFQIRRSRQIRVEKSKFKLDGAIGEHYGSTFEVKGGQLVKVKKNVDDSEEIAAEKESERDNRNLTDTSENQKLGKEDIHALRKEGATGQEIVGHLIENSATFKEKTEFAQEKYINKKKKKHLTLFTILKPNTRLLAQMYFKKGPTKICNLRLDSIAQILTHANVHAGCKLMIFESVTGLLVGAVLERLSSCGTVIQFYTGSAPARQAMEAYNFPSDVKKTLLSFPLNQVSTLSRENCLCATKQSKVTHSKREGKLKYSDDENNGTVEVLMESADISTETKHNVKIFKNEKGEPTTQEICKNVKMDIEDVESELSSKNNTSDKDIPSTYENTDSSMKDSKATEDTEHSDNCDQSCDDEMEKDPEVEMQDTSDNGNKRKSDWEEVKERRRNYRILENTKSQTLLESGTMDGLIIASKYHPTAIVMSLIDFVAPSRPIVIFSQYKEPLLDCYVKLRDRGGVLSLKVTETWFRHYQVLPNRTHPEINMSGTGGYLLTGTTVLLDN